MQSTHARVLLAASAFAISIAAGTLPAAADGGFFGAGFLNGLLKGTYAFTGTAGCLYAPGSAASPPSPGNTLPLANAGFNSSNQPIETNTLFLNTNSVEGTRIFNGNGTGSVKGTEMGYVGRPTPGLGIIPHFRHRRRRQLSAISLPIRKS